jgi:nucleotide-binding universal stress UspA family protein
MRLPGRATSAHRARGLEYQSVLVPLVDDPTAFEAVHVAARLAAVRRGKVTLLRVLVVPPELPLESHLAEQQAEAERLVAETAALAESLGVKVSRRVVRARHAGLAIVAEAARRQVDLVTLGAPRSAHRQIFGHTVDYVLKHSTTRVMVAAGKRRWVPFAGSTAVEPGTFRRILVPVKLGPIGEEMLGTAITLAAGHGATVEALHAVNVALELPLDEELLPDEEERAAAALAEARLLGAERGVGVETVTVRTRSIGKAIVERAAETGADVIVLGSAPRWRRQSRFFSPTVDYVLRRASAEVLIVAFPKGVLPGEQRR